MVPKFGVGVVFKQAGQPDGTASQVLPRHPGNSPKNSRHPFPGFRNTMPLSFRHSPVRRGLSAALRSRHGGILLFLGLFTTVSFLIRLMLLVRSADTVSWDWTLPAAFALGFFFDLGTGLVFALPLAVLLTAVPSAWFARRWFRGVLHGIFVAALALLFFGAVAECLFWGEFFVRFNFIAVDYLVYTREILQNVYETFNMPLIAAVFFLGTGLAYAAFLSTGGMRRWLAAAPRAHDRWPGFVCVALPNALVAVTAFALGWKGPEDDKRAEKPFAQGLGQMMALQPSFANAYNAELAKNGEYALFAAFWNNELRYDEFYPTLPDDTAFRRLRTLLGQDNATFTGANPRDITRAIRGDGPARRWNVIQITLESFSAEYLGCYRQAPYAAQKLTPNFDKIAAQSLWFRNFHASGTRTVRGMEALTLSVPPTPGQAVLRRPNTENLFTLGSVFQSRGYDTVFIYGGNGEFDNMNHFFSRNGYRVLDYAAKMRADQPRVTFENVWGVCDEDLLDWVLTEADRAHARGKNFHHFVMTTSNHRPYTWPEGRIDIPPGQGRRDGGVKYTDYAVGRFLREAEQRPWFKDTVFVFVADHCASVAGKNELEVNKYEIPLFIYAPGLIAPRTVDTLCGQVDFAPTLLGLMNWTYTSRFFGRDVLRPAAQPARAFVSNYQKIAILENNTLAVLKPVELSETFNYDPATRRLQLDAQPNQDLIQDTIAYYQCASELLDAGLQKSTTTPPLPVPGGAK